MLIITRREGERFMVGDDIVVQVLEVSGGSVRIGIDAPRSVPVHREELLRQDAPAAAAAAGPEPAH